LGRLLPCFSFETGIYRRRSLREGIQNESSAYA